MLFEEGVDLVVFGFGEAEGSGGDYAFDLFCIAAADDGCSYGWVVEGPGDGDDTGGNLVARADLFELVSYGEIAGEQRLLVVVGVAAEVVRGEVGDALLGHGSGEEPRVHGGVVDDADVVL